MGQLSSDDQLPYSHLNVRVSSVFGEIRSLLLSHVFSKYGVERAPDQIY